MIRAGVPAGIRVVCLAAGCGVAGAVWLTAPPLQAVDPNAAAAAVHVGMVCVAAPLLAASAAGSRADPVARWPDAFSPLAFALLQWAVVWAWHAPLVRAFAGEHPHLAWLPATGVLVVGVLLWLSILGGRDARYERVGAGIIALLTVSIQMTVLGGQWLIGSRPIPTAAVGAAPVPYEYGQPFAALVLLAGAAIMYVSAGALLVAWLLHPKARIDARMSGPSPP